MSVSISAILPTSDDWSHVEALSLSLAEQADRVGGQVIVAVACGDVPGDLPAHVRAIVVPGASVFELRARACEHAQGEIIAITEDHCEVPTDWCELLLDAHERHRSALAVAGAVDNGSTRSMSDWANYLLTFGAFAPPLQAQSDRAMPIANASFKRAAFERAERPLQVGWLEFDLNPTLLRNGDVAFDPRIVVSHVQSPGMAGALRSHFHNGRSTAGLLPRQTGASRWLAALRRLSIVPALVRQTALHVRDKPSYRTQFRRSYPMVVALALAHAIGEMVGVLAGAGRSPFALE